MSRQYYGIEDLGLTTDQRTILFDALKQLGHNNHFNPAHRNHWRVRLDNRAIIFEGQFNDEDWTIENLKNRLAALFEIDPSLIGTNITQTQYGPVVTFSRAGDRLRLIAFGGLLATWAQSHDLVLAYLAANYIAWEEVLP